MNHPELYEALGFMPVRVIGSDTVEALNHALKSAQQYPLLTAAVTPHRISAALLVCSNNTARSMLRPEVMAGFDAAVTLFLEEFVRLTTQDRTACNALNNLMAL